MEDSKIVELFWQRKEEAIECSRQKYGNRLLALAYAIVGDRQTAEECEDDTYMEAWKRIPPHCPSNYLYVFLARITRNISLNCCRNQKRLKRSAWICELDLEMQQCIPSKGEVEEYIDKKVLVERINHFLGTLDKEKRLIFVRRYWYMDSIAAISQCFQLSESKVKTTLFRCRNSLREYLEKEGYTL